MSQAKSKGSKTRDQGGMGHSGSSQSSDHHGGIHQGQELSTNSGPGPLRRPNNSPSNQQSSDKTTNIRYCHYFSNLGRCQYEERTKNQCRFTHDPAVPMCSSGISCTRNKCMYKHPRARGNPAFLGNNYNNSAHISPWQMILPWLNTIPTGSPQMFAGGQQQNPQN